MYNSFCRHSGESQSPHYQFNWILDLAAITACIFLLTACQQASTVVPTATQAELERERQTQAEMSKQAANEQATAPLNQAALAAKLERVARQVQPASQALCREMFGQQRKCDFDIALADKGGLNAYADGEKVVMFPEMIAFTRNDEELALVLTHELAHNIMGHPQATQQNVTIGTVFGTLADQLAASQGFNTGGALTKIISTGAVLKYSAGFEREADYTGLYILARSGYDISDTPQFWRRMSTKNPDSIYVGTTHPTNPDRYITLAKTIDEINAKRQAGQPLLPQRKPDA